VQATLALWQRATDEHAQPRALRELRGVHQMLCLLSAVHRCRLRCGWHHVLSKSSRLYQRDSLHSRPRRRRGAALVVAAGGGSWRGSKRSRVEATHVFPVS